MEKQSKLNRVDQLDANIIDHESKDILMRQLVQCFPQHIINKYQAEIRLLLDYLFFRFTISINEITPGNYLQNMDYKFKYQKQKIFLMLFTVFLPYLIQKLSDYISQNNWSDPNNLKKQMKDKLKYFLAKLLSYLINFQKIANLLNLLLFFMTHTGRSLSERILSIKLNKINPNQKRNLDFTYINRLIVWNALGTSLSQLLPFLDISKIKSMFQFSNKLTQYMTVDQSEISESENNWCAICGCSKISMPYRSKECGHTYCYICLAQKVDEEDWKCIKCGVVVKEIEKYTKM